MSRGLIVVGVDRSEISRGALRRAVEAARLSNARVRAAHAWWIYPMLISPGRLGDRPSRLSDEATGAVQAFIDEMLGEQPRRRVGAGRQAPAPLVDTGGGVPRVEALSQPRELK